MGNINFFNDLAKKSSSLMNTGRTFSLNFNLYKNIFCDIDGKMDFKNSDIVLDLGGGCGQITEHVAKRCKKVVLADGAENALNYARKKMSDLKNVSYCLLDINELPLSKIEGKFDKVVCYSVIHYLSDYDKFEALLENLLLLTNQGGKIFFGDIPFSEKRQSYLESRKKFIIKNFLLNLKYHLKRLITFIFYKKRSINIEQVEGLNWDQNLLENYLKKFSGIEYYFLDQGKKLVFSNTSEDLLVIKK